MIDSATSCRVYSNAGYDAAKSLCQVLSALLHLRRFVFVFVEKRERQYRRLLNPSKTKLLISTLVR